MVDHFNLLRETGLVCEDKNFASKGRMRLVHQFHGRNSPSDKCLQLANIHKCLIVAGIEY
jgi:hypothetical protein